MLLEIVNMATLRHRNVLEFIGVSSQFAGLTLVSPWMTNGTSRAHLANLRSGGQSIEGSLCAHSNKLVRPFTALAAIYLAVVYRGHSLDL